MCATELGFVISENGERLRDVKRGFASACRRAGLDGVSPHVLRHTCATWLMQRGVPMWEAAGFLGISRETPERVYGHYPPEYLRTATEALGSLSAECPRYPILFLQHFGGKCCKESPKNGAYREALFFSEGKGHKFESCRARHNFNDLAGLAREPPIAAEAPRKHSTGSNRTACRTPVGTGNELASR
jgi:hypothetical protein